MNRRGTATWQRLGAFHEMRHGVRDAATHCTAEQGGGSVRIASARPLISHAHVL